MNINFAQLEKENRTLKELQHLQEQGFNIKEIEQGLTISRIKDETLSAEEIIALLDKENK